MGLFVCDVTIAIFARLTVERAAQEVVRLCLHGARRWGAEPDAPAGFGSTERLSVFVTASYALPEDVPKPQGAYLLLLITWSSGCDDSTGRPNWSWSCRPVTFSGSTHSNFHHSLPIRSMYVLTFHDRLSTSIRGLFFHDQGPAAIKYKTGSIMTAFDTSRLVALRPEKWSSLFLAIEDRARRLTRERSMAIFIAPKPMRQSESPTLGVAMPLKSFALATPPCKAIVKAHYCQVRQPA